MAWWKASATGIRKINCDATFKDGKAALAVVICDDDGLHIVVRTKLLCLSSAYEAKVKALEWATCIAGKMQWRNFSFSSNAKGVVNEINSSKIPLSWFTRKAVMLICKTLFDKGWNLCWNERSTNFFADFVAKKALNGDKNVMFSYFNL